MKTKTRSLCFVALLVAVQLPLFASDYVFVNARYLSLTTTVIKEVDAKATGLFAARPEFVAKYETVRQNLSDQVDAFRHARFAKKIKPETVDQAHNKKFADALNAFKDALNAMADQSGQSLSALFPSYDVWNQTETAVVKTGLEQRLQAFQTRFGPDSEQVNGLELLLGEMYLPGDEAGPSPWEPILRLTPVQVTTAGHGLVSTIETGINYYFVSGAVPKPLSLAGLSNHVGMALGVQYTDQSQVMDFSGRPSFGVLFHLDRKEAGFFWNPTDNKVRFSFGYTFQVIPFVL